MSFFGFKSKKEVEAEKQKAAEKKTGNGGGATPKKK